MLLTSPPPPIATHVELRAPHGEMAFCLRRARLTSTRFAPVWAGATFVASVLRMGHFKSKKSKAKSSAGSSGAGVLRPLQPQPRHTPVPNADPGQASRRISSISHSDALPSFLKSTRPDTTATHKARACWPPHQSVLSQRPKKTAPEWTLCPSLLTCMPCDCRQSKPGPLRGRQGCCHYTTTAFPRQPGVHIYIYCHAFLRVNSSFSPITLDSVSNTHCIFAKQDINSIVISLTDDKGRPLPQNANQAAEVDFFPAKTSTARFSPRAGKISARRPSSKTTPRRAARRPRGFRRRAPRRRRTGTAHCRPALKYRRLCGVLFFSLNFLLP